MNESETQNLSFPAPPRLCARPPVRSFRLDLTDVCSGQRRHSYFYSQGNGALMITEQGIVEGVSGQKAIVRIEKSSACASCQSRDSCGEASGRNMVIEVANDLGAGEGDRIEISIPGGSFLILSLLVPSSCGGPYCRRCCRGGLCRHLAHEPDVRLYCRGLSRHRRHLLCPETSRQIKPRSEGIPAPDDADPAPFRSPSSGERSGIVSVCSPIGTRAYRDFPA